MKPFLQGKKSLDVSSLRLPSGLAASNAAPRDSARAPSVTTRPQASSHSHGPSTGSNARGAHVELINEGDKVVRLIVTCTCGERIEVECLYPAGT